MEGLLGPVWTSERFVSGCAVVLGWIWLGAGAASGPSGFAWAAIPGTLLLVGGVGFISAPRDASNLQFAAMAAFAGVPLSLGFSLFERFGVGAALGAGSALMLWLIGAHGAARVPTVSQVPDARQGSLVQLGVGLDRAMLGWFKVRLRYPATPAAIDRIGAQLEAALRLARERGWGRTPETYLREPVAPDRFELRSRRLVGRPYEHLTFASEFELHPGEPAAEEFAAVQSNRTVHAWILRHPGPPRPWLIGIHGYRLGFPLQDFFLYPPRFFHDALGLNLALCVLPLHGPRRAGLLSGDGFMDGDPIRTLYAEAQADWDLRRLVAWIDAQGAPFMGVMGVSLGGYSAALLATTCSRLRFAILGTPPADLARLYACHGPPALLRRLEQVGVSESRVRELFRPVSPLERPVQVPMSGRLIYGGIADEVVPSDQVRDLWEHWEGPRTLWYQGGHLPMTRELGRAIRQTIEVARSLSED